MRSRAALLPTQSSICYIAERDASTFSWRRSLVCYGAKGPGAWPWRAVSNLSEPSYQLLFWLTVAFLPQCRVLRRSLLYHSSRFCCCVAIGAGWKMTAAATVVRSDRPISLPMLDVPGWREKYRLPKAIAVVQALKRMARVRLDCRKFVSPDRQAMM